MKYVYSFKEGNKEMKNLCWRKNESPNRIVVQSGDFSLLYRGKVLTKIFVALAAII